MDRSDPSGVTTLAQQHGIKQVAIVVADLEASVRAYWELLRTGSWTAFTYDPSFLLDMRYRGKPARFGLRHALAWRQGVQLELVQPLEGPSIFKDHLDAHGEGPHHVGPDDDGWFGSNEGRDFFAVAAERRLIASIAASPAWQADTRTLARALPSLPILCHHLAGIRPGDPSSAAALETILESADCANIFVKVSGFYYGAVEPWDYPYPAVLPLVRRLYDRLGGNRLIWGSDYPVSRPHMTYRQTLEVVRTHCRFIPPTDMDRVLGDTLAGLLAGAGDRA